MNIKPEKESEELQRLENIVKEISQSEGVALRLVYPAPKRKNDSKKIIVCGGSFNPIHNGHRELIEKAIESVDGAEVLLLIALKHSEDKPMTGATFAQRLYMLGMEQKRLPFVSVGVINDGFYRNWMPRLKEFHPDEDLEYINLVGADLFVQTIDDKEVDEFPKVFAVDWIVAERNGKSWQDYEIPNCIKPFIGKISSLQLSEDVCDVSSSGISKLLNDKDEAVLDCVARDHFEFILRHNIRF